MGNAYDASRDGLRFPVRSLREQAIRFERRTLADEMAAQRRVDPEHARRLAEQRRQAVNEALAASGIRAVRPAAGLDEQIGDADAFDDTKTPGAAPPLFCAACGDKLTRHHVTAAGTAKCSCGQEHALDDDTYAALMADDGAEFGDARCPACERRFALRSHDGTSVDVRCPACGASASVRDVRLNRAARRRLARQQDALTRQRSGREPLLYGRDGEPVL